MIFAQIEISGIPVIYPKTLTDIQEIENRLTLLPDQFETTIKSDDLYTDIFEPALFEEKTLQKVIFDKYECEVYINENTDLNTLKHARFATVNTGVETFTCRITDIDYSKLSESTMYKCTIKMYRIKDVEESVINYYSYPECLYNGYVLSDLNKLELTNDKDVDDVEFLTSSTVLNFYTALNPEWDRVETDSKSDKTTGEEIRNFDVDFATCTLRFILTLTEFLNLRKCLRRCFYKDINDSWNPKGTRFVFKTGTQLYDIVQAVESATYKVNEKSKLVNKYDVSVTLKFNKVMFNYYV